MYISATELPEVKVLQWEEHIEVRGSSYSHYSQRNLQDAGIIFDCVEETVYHAHKKGTFYGIHFQNMPMAQAKLLYCIAGSGLDFAIDLRKQSPNYKKWVSIELSAENRKQIFIPKGFGHGFFALEDNTKVVMRIDNYFDPEYRRGILWNDPEIGLILPSAAPILAPHDISAPLLKVSDCNL